MKNIVLWSVVILCVSFGLGLVIIGVDRSHPTKTSLALVKGATVSSQVPLLPVLATKKVLLAQVPDEQVVVLLGEIEPETASQAVSEIMVKAINKKPIWLLINSPGGSVIDGALVISTMESAGVPVYTVCMQLCASMAAVIHQHGTKRYMLDRSILMFHDAAGGFQGYMPHVEAQFNVVNRYVNKLNNYIAQRAGITPDDWMAIVHKNLWIDGEDSVNRKLADSLVFIKVVNTKGSVDMTSLLRPVPLQKTTPNAVPNNPFHGLTL